MTDLYTKIDNSPLLSFLFYPRRQHSKPPDGAMDIEVQVDEGVKIVCRAYRGDDKMPWILYFHGNGEVVSDYDGIAPLYTNRGLNLLVVDYRGYGASGGNPGFKNMIIDADTIFNFLYEKMLADGENSSWFVMGRSMGSVSALELASRYPLKIKGLIIESGFISIAGLVRHLGLPAPGDLSPIEDQYKKLASAIELPALVIHGEHDRLVPIEQGQDLIDSLGSENKKMVVIPRADHNDVIFADSRIYFDAVEDFIKSVM